MIVVTFIRLANEFVKSVWAVPMLSTNAIKTGLSSYATFGLSSGEAPSELPGAWAPSALSGNSLSVLMLFEGDNALCCSCSKEASVSKKGPSSTWLNSWLNKGWKSDASSTLMSASLHSQSLRSQRCWLCGATVKDVSRGGASCGGCCERNAGCAGYWPHQRPPLT
jgi:hypothetical protein